MNFKKLISIVTVLALATALICGCGKKNDNKKTVETDQSELSSAVTLSDYKNIEIDWETEENEQALLSALAEYGVDRPVKNGDTVNIDYKGLKDGIAFAGGTAEKQDLVIGSGSFIDGFEEGLIGAKIGEQRDLNLTFPEQYHSADLAGADVVFEVKVNSIASSDVNDYSAENVKKAKSKAAGSIILSKALEDSEVGEISEKTKNSYTENYDRIQRKYVEESGQSFSAFLSSNSLTLDSYNEKIAELSKSQMETDAVILAIAEKEKIALAGDDYTKGLLKLAENEGKTSEEFESLYGKDTTKNFILREKVIEALGAQYKE